jgi:hypothetical protein
VGRRLRFVPARWNTTRGATGSSSVPWTSQRVADLIRQIVVNGTRARRRSSSRSMGRDAILRQNPHAQPRQVKRGPSPACHAASRKWRRRLRESYAIFVVAYRRASELLRARDLTARFPPGCFPPPLPFVPAGSG